MDVDTATMDPRDNYRRRSPSPIRPRYSRSRSRSRSRGRYRSPRRYIRSRSPPRHYRRSPPRHYRRTRDVIRGSEEERMRSCSIFVGNLPYSFEERDVVNLFERFGRLGTVSVPMDRYTRRNRGFSFVEFEQRADAEDAFNKYNGYEIEGRRLRLDWDIGRSAKDSIRGDRSPRRERNDRDCIKNRFDWTDLLFICL